MCGEGLQVKLPCLPGKYHSPLLCHFLGPKSPSSCIPIFRRTSTQAESPLRSPLAITWFTRYVSWRTTWKDANLTFQTCFDDMLKSGHYACPVCGVRSVWLDKSILISNIRFCFCCFVYSMTFNLTNWFQLSMMDMSDVWKIYDREISETPMPSNIKIAFCRSIINTCVQGNTKTWPVRSNVEIAWRKALESSIS